MFGYGFLAVVLVLYLDALGLDPLAIGIVLTLTLIGDTIISLWLTTNADRFGRRRVLVAGAALMVVAGFVFAFTQLGAAARSWPATIGVISPTGNEVGPFLAVEQAALSQTVHDVRRTRDLRLVQPRRVRRDGDRGARRPGSSARCCSMAAWAPVDAYRAVVIGYAVIGLAMVVGFWRLDAAIEAPPREASTDGIRRRLGLGRSKKIVLKLSVLFSHRRLRWRVHPAEPDGVLVPHAVRRRAGASSARSSSARTCSPPCRRSPRPGSRPGSD